MRLNERGRGLWLSVTVPVTTLVRPARTLRSEVLPPPDGPMIASSSLGFLFFLIG